MTTDEVKEIFDRVLSWPPEDQEKLAQFVNGFEQWRASDDLTDGDWKTIEQRIARRDLATDQEVEIVFSRHQRDNHRFQSERAGGPAVLPHHSRPLVARKSPPDPGSGPQESGVKQPCCKRARLSLTLRRRTQCQDVATR